MAKRIGIGDWVLGETDEYDYIGFVLAKDKYQCRIQITQLYHLGLNKTVDLTKTKTITQPVSKIILLEDYHPDDIKELIDMSLDRKNKKDFNVLVKQLNQETNEKLKNFWRIKK